MKKLLVIFLLLTTCVFAREANYFLGFQNSKYAFVGIETPYRFGIAIKNSVFVEQIEFQYVRAAIFYNFFAPFGLSGQYRLYSGIRYNKDYYDIGGIVDLQWKLVVNLLQVSGSFLSNYDSDLGVKEAYCVELQITPFREIGLFAGMKNLPEYRNTEQRVYGGIVFDVPHMLVKPEISVPTNSELAATRVSVSFVYRNII